MAVNLAGMFGNMNQAIQGAGAPLGAVDTTVAGMTKRPMDNMNPMLQGMMAGVGGVANNLLGTDMDLRTSQQVKREGDKALQDKDLSTATGLSEAAEVYAKMGMTDKAVQFGQLAQTAQQTELANKRRMDTVVSVAKGWDALGKPEQAEIIRSKANVTDIDQRQLKEAQVAATTLEASTAGKNAYLKAYGVDPKTMPDGYENMTDDQIEDIVTPKEAELKDYKGYNGKIHSLPTNKAAMVRLPSGKWVYPSDSGLEAWDPKYQYIKDGQNIAVMLDGKKIANIDTLSPEARTKAVNQEMEHNALMVGNSQKIIDMILAGEHDGGFDAWIESLPATAQHDVQQLMMTLTAGQALDRLTQLKATGATLGQVSAPELELLKAAQGSLVTSQSREQLLDAVTRVNNHYRRVNKALMGDDSAYTKNKDGSIAFRQDASTVVLVQPDGSMEIFRDKK